AAVRRAAEQGFHELQVLRFPASYCNDHGRRMTVAEPDWPGPLGGFPWRGRQRCGAGLAGVAGRLRQAGVRVLRQGTEAPGLQAARADSRLSAWTAGRRRAFPLLVAALLARGVPSAD